MIPRLDDVRAVAEALDDEIEVRLTPDGEVELRAHGVVETYPTCEEAIQGLRASWGTSDEDDDDMRSEYDFSNAKRRSPVVCREVSS